MLFNSTEYIIFFPLVFAIYWMARDLKIQNWILLLASYIFYGWWDWRFLTLIFASSVLDFILGRQMDLISEERKRKWLLGLSLAFNLGMLLVFKYFDFFIDEFAVLLDEVGIKPHLSTLNLILPVGISFYTFQTLSYTIDVYRKKMKPTHNFIAFLSYVSFFPQLVAGPIERAKNLLPQFQQRRTFRYADSVDGMRQILIGFFKKIVIADNCAVFVNLIFASDYEAMHSLWLIAGIVLFSFQIYGDFSGYSDIAIGTARLFGIRLMKNFDFPYFSRDIAEFWRRWHISLSSWFRDYLYFPLGGSRGGKLITLRNILIVFLVSGLWHGANWTFIIWGGYHALLFVPLYLFGVNRSNLSIVAKDKLLPSFSEFFMVVLTFVLVSIGWLFFRSANMAEALDYAIHLTQNFSLELNYLNHDKTLNYNLFITVLNVGLLVVLEWMNRTKDHALDMELAHHRHWALYGLLFLVIIYHGEFNETEFIYFQF